MAASAATNQQQEEHAEKAVEVENILIEKLEESIKRSSPWSSRFSKCKELLKKELDDESHPDRKFRARFRRKVHHLNNFMAEHDSIINYGNALHVYRLSQIKKEIGSVRKAEVDNADRSSKGHTQRVPSRPSPIAVHGLEVDQMAAENLLLCRDSSPEFNAVGIYGAEGVGKTTLALAIFHSDKVKSRFLPRIWICLTDRQKSETDSDEIFVAKRILLHLGIDLETINKMDPPGSEGLKRAIKTELKRKRYLVVIDGVSEEMELGRMKSVMEMLREALPKGVGGAVVVTGRAKKVVEAMVGGEEGIYQLQLSEKQVKC